MSATPLLPLLPGIFISIGSLTAASSSILLPKYTASTSSLFPPSIQQEVHLVQSLLVETNKSFDEKIGNSARSLVKPTAIISFHLITFVFHYPTTNDFVVSSNEMCQPDGLICTGKSVSRRSGSTNEIPMNYVRIVDRHRKEISADLDLLVGEAPLNDPGSIHYSRRSFRFVYRDGWKEG